MSEQIERRLKAATAGRKYLTEELSWHAFIDEFSESDDELIENLVGLIEHEPKRGGFMGVNESKWLEYRNEVTNAIAVLERT